MNSFISVEKTGRGVKSQTSLLVCLSTDTYQPPAVHYWAGWIKVAFRWVSRKAPVHHSANILQITPHCTCGSPASSASLHCRGTKCRCLYPMSQMWGTERFRTHLQSHERCDTEQEPKLRFPVPRLLFRKDLSTKVTQALNKIHKVFLRGVPRRQHSTGVIT